MNAAGRLKIGSVVVHCHYFARMVTFWQAALGYIQRGPASDGWIVLRDPDGRGPNVSLQARDRPRACRSWLHLDLYTANQQQEIERLLALGASRYPWRYPSGGDYVVLADPDGNLFCVVQKEDRD